MKKPLYSAYSVRLVNTVTSDWRARESSLGDVPEPENGREKDWVDLLPVSDENKRKLSDDDMWHGWNGTGYWLTGDVLCPTYTQLQLWWVIFSAW